MSANKDGGLLVYLSVDGISALVFPLLLPSQNIWASTVRVTLFSIGDRST